MKSIILSLLLSLPFCFGSVSYAATHAAATCGTSDVQAAITAASEGDTVTIPAGTCTWTSGVTIEKGLTVVGAGSSRTIAIGHTSSAVALANGSLTLPVTSTNVSGALSITPGQTLTVNELGAEANYMTGTVTSYSSGSLVMNITSHGGACGSNGDSSNGPSNCKRWMISTPATTTIVNSSPTQTLFAVVEDTSLHTNISGLTFMPGAVQNHIFSLYYVAGGKAILLHDMRFSGDPNATPAPEGNRDMIESDTNRGVVWNCSFDSIEFNIANMGAVDVKDSSNVTGNSWNTVSNMGSLDTDGQGELFVENNDFHAFGFATGNDDNGRMVVRYNLYDNSGMMGTHGADTSNYGQRYFEAYNNVGVFEAYQDGTTFNLNDWVYMRGGTGLIYNNTLDQLHSSDYGDKPDNNMTVQNLGRSAGPDPCWGLNTTGGAKHYAPRQIGVGYVTGTGHAGTGITSDSITYVGDPEPFYIWGNSRSPLNDSISDYGSGDAEYCGGTPDLAANYLVQGRDYYDNGTAKPGWTAYTYPHPLASGVSLTATTTTLTAASTSLSAGASDLLTSTVASSSATGTVTFYDGGSVLGAVTLSSGTATFNVVDITAGTHNYTANYGGNGTYASSTSSAVSVTATSISVPTGLVSRGIAYQ